MDLLNSLITEFDVINGKLDLIASCISKNNLQKVDKEKYDDLNKMREEINYNER